MRTALDRYSTWHEEAGIDVAALAACDLGDVADPDADEAATIAAVRAAADALPAFRLPTNDRPEGSA